MWEGSIMKNFSCLIGLHKYKTFGYSDKYTSELCSSNTIKHLVVYQECSLCSKRRIIGDKAYWKLYDAMHRGIQIAQIEWVENRKMSLPMVYKKKE